MAGPSVTYTFANSTTADATQVNQNFTDIINGLTDGTKDLSISALTCGGTATLNGSVNLGNASADDLTVTASLASSIPVKTTASFDIGSSTLGLRAVYFGANSQTVNVRGSGSMSATWTLTLPTTAGSSGQFLRTDGAGTSSWVAARSGPYDRVNYGLTASVAASALTVALKAADGNDATSVNPVNVVFRSATATTGMPVDRAVTGSLSIDVTSGATLGHTDGNTGYVYVYALDNAGTVELAVAGSRMFDEGVLQTTTGMGATADNGETLYSTTSRSNVPIRFLGRIKSSQATAGTWASAPSEISLELGAARPRSEVILHTGNGWGSTNTTVLRFSTAGKNIGTDIVYADSAANGASFTITSSGVYAANLCGQGSDTNYIAITVNCSLLTSNPASITYAQGLRASGMFPAPNVQGIASWTGALNAGDILRFQATASGSFTNTLCLGSVVKVSD